MWKKLSNTQRVILIGIAILVIVEIILWGNVARLKNPLSKFEDAINAGDVKTAVASYGLMQGSAARNQRFEAEKLGLKYAKIRIGEYLQGKSDYDSVSGEVYALKESVLAKDTQIDPHLEKMEARYASESALKAADEARTTGDYETAKEYYARVEDGQPGYEEAQTAIKECEALEDDRARQAVETAMGMIDVNEDIHTYLQAVDYLDEYIRNYSEDNFVSARRVQFLDEYYNIQLQNIDTLLLHKKEKDALDLAKELKELLPDRKEADEYIKKIEADTKKKK